METIKTLTYLVDKEIVEKLFRIGLIFKSDEQYFIFPQHYEKVKLTLSKLLEEEIHEMFEEMYFKEYKLYSFVSKEKDLFRSLKHIAIKRKTYHHRLKLVRYCNLTIKKLKDYQGNIIRYIIIPNNTDILVCTSDSLKYKVVSQDIPTERYIEDYINEYVDTEEKKIVLIKSALLGRMDLDISKVTNYKYGYICPNCEKITFSDEPLKDGYFICNHDKNKKIEEYIDFPLREAKSYIYNSKIYRLSSLISLLNSLREETLLYNVVEKQFYIVRNSIIINTETNYPLVYNIEKMKQEKWFIYNL